MSQVVESYEEIKKLVTDLELDVVKNGVKSNNAAGVRVRKGLRKLKSLATALVKLTVTLDKASKEPKTETE